MVCVTLSPTTVQMRCVECSYHLREVRPDTHRYAYTEKRVGEKVPAL